MPVQVSYPGVYIQEVASGARTITGVSTSIAAFVGMAKQGPKNLPVQVLGFLDYTRTFSNDISQGEMTDQVRQFFTNGGQQAVVVRIGDDSLTEAFVDLESLNGKKILKLTAVSAGEAGEELRATVDYNTSSPGRTFNLTVFREVLDASGNPTRPVSELFKDLSMDPDDPRYVLDVLKASNLVTAAVSSTENTLSSADQGSSSSGVLATDILDTFTKAIPTAGAQGKFRISVGGAPFRTVTFTRPLSGNLATTDIQNTIESQLGLAAGTLAVDTVVAPAVSPPNPLQFLRISSTKHQDVVIERAADSDIALKLGLGVAQGGVELGAYQTHRPIPNGLVSVLGDDLAALLTFGQSLKSGWKGASPPHIHIDGSVPLDLAGDKVTFKATGPTMLEGDKAGYHLLNIRDNLQAIADAINAQVKNGTTSGWDAAMPENGFRLVLTPSSKLGPSSLVAGAFFAAGGPVGFADTESIFDNATVTSTPGASKLEGGVDGGAPALTNYQAAFTALDQQVDLFNILVLPRSADDSTHPRQDIWGDASTFALNRRAFLLIDPSSDDSTSEPTIDQAGKDVVALRVGLVKDHAAAYWPRIKINPDGNTRYIDPSGSVAGIMARIDTNRGVWKAPAGLEADLRGVLGVRAPMTDMENGQLNPKALNAIRLFPNGIVVWGARTMDGFDNSGDDDFKYVPVRRFELFIEESLMRGLKFAVFEPNAEPLWGQIRIAVGGFMNNLFRQGAFAGATKNESYFVKVDSETTTQNDINLGIVNVVVGFAPLKPAEFVVITIKQMAGQIQV
jgi:uncharacterized protein